jgi:arginyl-tRNA synthetase
VINLDEPFFFSLYVKDIYFQQQEDFMNPVKNIRDQIRKVVEGALAQCVTAGKFSLGVPAEFVVEVPKQKDHGDFACNVAMLLAKPLRTAPRGIAEMIAAAIACPPGGLLQKVEVAGAGFINFYLNPQWLQAIPRLVEEQGSAYGRGAPTGQKIQVEFVSANPTGNLHMGNARGGAFGDSLASLLEAAGHAIEREYYINDAGNQIEMLAVSLEARYLQLLGHDAPFPENGYAGQDLVESVKELIAEYGEAFIGLEPSVRREELTRIALADKLDYIKTTLERFGIVYDHWFKESALYENGQVQAVVAYLQEQGCTYEQEGAIWLKTGAGDADKDAVLVRANGIPTYFAADIAYHKDKFDRGFHRVIDIWGADHHGHVARMKGAMAAIGRDPDALSMVLVQLVRLYRGGEIVRMSKRTGTTVSLDELLDEVGVDAARFFFVMRNPDSHLDFDLELARQTSQENPVYYAQYAHARICSVFRQAQAAGLSLPAAAEADASVMGAAEFSVLRKIADYPEEVAGAAEALAPHRLARYVLDLAGDFHSYYNHNRVLGEDQALQTARLVLLKTIQITINNALAILGVSAPEQM